ncbi:exodeoxyribonuclease VII large subunit [Haloarcula hispanica]|uniref:Exodeoxyribonuclease VII large subunit n=1 Tax=Haloarcula hispanica TaxID=51589 RepID=A0A482TPT7_HALHI|nr:exodeoxyribonuclease VII large subunit [Haloarcula hispanica]MCJ0618188.1 exodeoxyribonuclease VII large subunit [Haloarcula hispanica]RYJ15693.1 exodeoxyribonuclease VII large subunit [Haloarcula hispanica]
MGSEPEPTHTSLETLQEALQTERITYVDTLNEDIGAVVESADQLAFDYVVGDVSDYGVSSSDHVHLDLVHEGSTIHCVLFGYKRSTIDTTIEDGMQVAVKGSLSYYEDGGNVSVIVEDIVAVGEGTYQQIYEQNRELLDSDGLLDPEHKQALPDFPERIGIATSATSDARMDAITSVHERYPDVDIVIQNTSVQGDDAMMSIMGAISELDDDPLIDVIVLTRGGGSDKHLRVFNETPLCRVIHKTETPIVVGVGHENDRTLADEVADRRVMTPTEVGNIVPERTTLDAELDTLEDRLNTAYTATVETTLETMDDRLTHAYRRTAESDLSSFEAELDRAYDTHVRDALTDLENRLEQARTQYDQERKRKQEATAYRRQRRRLLLVLLALGLLVVALLLYILLPL